MFEKEVEFINSIPNDNPVLFYINFVESEAYQTLNLSNCDYLLALNASYKNTKVNDALYILLSIPFLRPEKNNPILNQVCNLLYTKISHKDLIELKNELGNGWDFLKNNSITSKLSKLKESELEFLINNCPPSSMCNSDSTIYLFTACILYCLLIKNPQYKNTRFEARINSILDTINLQNQKPEPPQEKTFTFTEKEAIEKIKSDPTYLKFFDNPTEEMQLTAVEQFQSTLSYIKNPSEKVQIKAVETAISNSKKSIENYCNCDFISCLIPYITSPEALKLAEEERKERDKLLSDKKRNKEEPTTATTTAQKEIPLLIGLAALSAVGIGWLSSSKSKKPIKKTVTNIKKEELNENTSKEEEINVNRRTK